MRVLLDECLPFDLAPLLRGHEVTPVGRAGWAGIKNGALLPLAAERFDAFLTIDQRLAREHPIPPSLVVVTVRAPSNRVQDISPLVPSILKVLAGAPPGQIARVGAQPGQEVDERGGATSA